jgi:chromosome segregation ATPase
MSLLRTSKVSMRRNTLLLIAACLLLAAPCVAAAAFALHLDIDNPQPPTGQKQESPLESPQKLERARAEMQEAREELQRKRRELEERVRKNPNAQGADLETLHRMERELEEASARLSHEQEARYFQDAEQDLRQLNEKLSHAMATYPEAEARMREAREKLEQMQKSLPENAARARELREQIALAEKQFLDAKLTAEQVQSLRRAQEEIALQQEAFSQEQREKIEEKLKLERRIEEVVEQQEREAREKREAVEDEIKSKIKNKDYNKQIRKDVDKRIRKELENAGREGQAKEQAELTQLATLSMDRAIQIAISQHPGKVLSCSLGRHQDGQAFYRLVIINGEGSKSSATHVWVSATDGRILKTEHE